MSVLLKSSTTLLSFTDSLEFKASPSARLEEGNFQSTTLILFPYYLLFDFYFQLHSRNCLFFMENSIKCFQKANLKFTKTAIIERKFTVI